MSQPRTSNIFQANVSPPHPKYGTPDYGEHFPGILLWRVDGMTEDSVLGKHGLGSKNQPRSPLHTQERLQVSESTGLSQESGVPPPLSFKRRSRDVSLGFSGMRRWIGQDSNRNSSVFSARHRANRASDGWEHPGRYVSASQVSVPSILPLKPPSSHSNPIPTLPYTVLCMLIFGEFCSSGVAGPFLFFMLKDYDLGDESRVGFWAGIVASLFFLAQFLTSLMWSSVAEKKGSRFVLRASMIGNSLSLIAFGFAPNLPLAILFRLSQGFFNGAVGVAKGAVRSLTDETNEGRAYAQMGFWWGMGGIVGPILGGVLEHPATKYAWLFGQSQFLHAHPYVLPCILAATSTIIGAFLSFFLEEDLKPSVGAIHLPEEPQTILRSPSQEDVERSGWSFTSSAWSRLRGRHSLQQPRWPLAFGPRTRQVSSGTAYGYHEPRRLRCVSTASRISSDAGPGMRSPELLTTEDLREYDHEENKRKSLVERFVLSNDDAVLSLTDLWVAAAANMEEDRHRESESDAIQEEDEWDYHDSEDDTSHPFHSTPSLIPTQTSSSYVPPLHFARASKLHRTHEETSRQAINMSPSSPPSRTIPSASPIWMLPLVVIGHYSVLSFHSSMFDQVFMAFLVTPEPSGGLGLTASHYAGLIATMTLCQLLFQFQVYPSLGPPNGSLSHLSVLQTGVLLYLPCYVLFPFLRSFLLPNTDAAVMLGMIVFAALRWLANILSFTSVMVLLNGWTPLHLVPLANGLAQTMSSFARCIGPITGGTIWAHSIQGGPYAHAWPFNFHLGFWVVGLVAFTGAIHTRFIREVTFP